MSYYSKPNVTEDVLELLAWKKATRIIYNYRPNPFRSLVRQLIEDLNIQEATARMFVSIYQEHKEEIIQNIEQEPFKNQ